MRPRIHAITLCAALIMVGAFALTQQATAGNTTTPPKGGDCIVIDCPKSPGFWMNHPKAWEGIVDKDYQNWLISMMKAPVKGDKVMTMFPALIAADLNQYYCPWDAPQGIEIVIAAGHWWMGTYVYIYDKDYNIIGFNEVRANSRAWQETGELIYMILDAYNNDLL